MMSPPEFILAVGGVIGGTMVLLSPVTIVKAILQHREKMATIKYGSEGSPALQEEVQRLRREVADLRETTTRFDLSFDAGLARVEDRLSSLEQEPLQSPYHTTTVSSAPVAERIEVGARRG